MITTRARHRQRADGNGVVWAASGTGTPSAVRDIFGPRPFAAHIPTVGFDYDWHRGIDEPLAAGDPLRTPIAGNVIRLHRTHFGWETDNQLTYWTEDDPGGAATFARSGSNLRVTGSRVGAQTIAQSARWKAILERSIINAGDWEMRLKLAGTGALAAGKLGFGLYNETTNQYVTLEWDGTNATSLGNGAAGLLTANGTNRAVTTETWFRIRLSGTTLSWAVSADASTWTNIATETIAAGTFTDSSRPVFRPITYWRSTDTAGGTIVVDVDFFGWNDPRTIDRFGNWIEVAQATRRIILMHFQDIDVTIGDVVEAGQLVGKAGMTGFDDRSGPILAPHVHVEWIADNLHDYNNDSPINPLGVGLLPRANVSNNVAVTRTTANDPDAVDSWRLRIVVTRQDQDFDVNTVTLTGNTASRIINFNTRAGLNADNDIPKQAGVYIVPVSFTEASSTYEVSVYFNKSVVGSTFVSASVTDTAGTTLWSE